MKGTRTRRGDADGVLWTELVDLAARDSPTDGDDKLKVELLDRRVLEVDKREERSARALMTLPRVANDLLMVAPSLRRTRLRSLPARSLMSRGRKSIGRVAVLIRLCCGCYGYRPSSQIDQVDLSACFAW
jgi:hypothetical protein